MKKRQMVEVVLTGIRKNSIYIYIHKIYYKFEGHAPEYISRDLRECSDIVSQLDAKMLSLNNAILIAKEQAKVHGAKMHSAKVHSA